MFSNGVDAGLTQPPYTVTPQNMAEPDNLPKSPPPALTPRYPSNLPIVEYRERIIEAMKTHQVIILSGETGSGKTTQIPKMCIEAGLDAGRLIACTQPRRIAALTVAARIREELQDEGVVGCKIRFHDSSTPGNRIRIMTDGMLLAETQGDPELRAYSTLIIDEAHERSLNIDVLLGMLRRLIDRRPDVKVIITSATLDTEKFSRHFRDAPIIEVEGRTFPVEVRYEEPVDDEANMSLPEQTARAVGRLIAQSRQGDVLVFLPTEQDIRESMDIIDRETSNRLNIVPLYARLPTSEQKKAFVSGGRRKIVVATNVAETSLTVPGIRYVVDSGLARISRYNPGTGTHALPVDRISRASAAQRAGRCGRVQDGVCIRMYSEEDYQSRPEFTPPEIRRTNLAEVVLRLLDIDIEDIESFPFVDPPESSGVRDALRTLREIGALEKRAGKKPSGKSRTLSKDGRFMARLPLDPRLARMLIQADREGCLGDLLPVAASLSLSDPRERPPGKTGKAEAVHRAFLDSQSDFISRLNIWDRFRTYKRKGSFSGRLKHFCRENFLSYRRMREWIDIHRQLALIMEENGFRLRRRSAAPSVDGKGNFTSRYAAIHRSILSGFLSHIAKRAEKGSYEATRRRMLRIHPGSAVGKGGGEWIMAAEIVRTARLYARSVAVIDPDWLEDLGRNLIEKNWINPHWSRRSAAVMATEQVRLFGFLISDGKSVPYGPVRPEEARDIFIQSALVEQDLADTGVYAFLEANAALKQRLTDMENKLRRRDLVAGDDAVTAFYSQRLPREVLDIGTLNQYLKEEGDKQLRMAEDDLLTGVDAGGSSENYPDRVNIAGDAWKLSYEFDPESEADGVSLMVPPGRISDLRPQEADWLVPGLLREKIEALMRTLPKVHRRRLIPIPETAEAALHGMQRGETDLIRSLSIWLHRERGVRIPSNDWNPGSIPPHLQLRFSLLDDAGEEMKFGRNMEELAVSERGQNSGGQRQVFREQHERTGMRTWPDGDLPESVRLPGGAVLWPALKDEGGSVSLRYFNEKIEAEREQIAGQCALARLHWAREIKGFRRSLFLKGRARTAAVDAGGPQKIEDAVWDRVIMSIFGGGIVREEKQWGELLVNGGREIHPLGAECFSSVASVLEAYGEVHGLLQALAKKGHRTAFVRDRIAEAKALISVDFLRRTEDWAPLPRWLRAVVVRTQRGLLNPARDQRFFAVWETLKKRYDSIEAQINTLTSDEKHRALKKASVMLEELKIALFAAGEIRAAGKISETRLNRYMDKIDDMF